ncbi:uncharacterized protein LTR77_008547 [Saxophila tyrrhenica]|uniref:UBA domain-containing protein n=1 Tax=Saxophila tyrrhenica TaxID=1690608 RepID=A0AAV9P224_9PEZI|nr:hypothetical protein LTR77_008547 [Saxophila tyrrhenica]
MSRKRKQPLIQYGKRNKRNLPLPIPSSPSPPPTSSAMSWLPSADEIDKTQRPNPNPPPHKPISQKDATMVAEPSADNIGMMLEICAGISQQEAVKYLKAKHNNLEAAIDAALNNENVDAALQASTWDDNLMSADRDGGYDPHLRPLGVSSAAATRPNSPAGSHRSNLHPTNRQEEDEDMQRALAMSQADAGVPIYGQETGVVGPGGGQPVSGPAKKEAYDKDQWAMVPTGANKTGWGQATEVVPDQEAQDRVLRSGEPRVLKQLPDGDYMPNLLTICAAIPAAKKALLMQEYVQVDYGQDAEWWRGHPIAKPRIVHVGDGSAVEPESDCQDELFAEVQRLMAFLTASDRSYASAGALTQTEFLKRTSPMVTRSRTLLELFLQTWSMAASSNVGVDGDVSRIFTTTVGTSAPEGMDTPDMSLIDLQVTLGEGEKADLFELLDGLLWETDADSTAMSDNFIERPADVLVMRAHQSNPAVAKQLRVEVPPEFYVDKYLKDNIAATRATRREMANSKRRIAKIEEIEKKLRTWKHPTKNESLDAGLLLKHTLGHFTGQNLLNASKNDRNHSTDELAEQPPAYQDISSKLEKLVVNIESKLQVLTEEKEKSRQAISSMSKAPPPGLEYEEQQYRYTLRGVATRPDTTYVLLPNTLDADVELIEDEHTPAGWRWWRVEYKADGSSDSSPTVTKTLASDFDVLRAVELEHSSALLVYASDAAMNDRQTEHGLPEALRKFIANDNALFDAELQRAKDGGGGNDTSNYGVTHIDLTDAPRQSIERSSMDSTRVEGSFNGSDRGDPPDYYKGPPDFGLGPNLDKRGDAMEEDEAPVVEIRLDDEGEGQGSEMVERGNGGLMGGMERGEGGQDDGVGGRGG